MPIKDVELALLRVREYLALIERSDSMVSSSKANAFATMVEKIYGKAAEQGLLEKGPLVEGIAAEVYDDEFASRLRNPLARDQACRQLLGALIALQELPTIIQKSPTFELEELHPWVWHSAGDLWLGGHRREAVITACAALFDSHIPAKLGQLRDPHGASSLLGQAFTVKDPVPDTPRLRLPGYEHGSQDWKNAHEGAMHFGQGCAMAIRNLRTHDVEEPDEDVALEMLAALSFLARLVDQAEVVDYDPQATGRD